MVQLYSILLVDLTDSLKLEILRLILNLVVEYDAGVRWE